jgi:CubicO group peptidase (beta-lactamase class C family)
MLKIKILLAIFISLAATALTNSQITEIQKIKIDSLVAKWDNPDLPGGAVGIMWNGKLMYAKSFGLASLDYDIPNNEMTLFNIGSISKQFTAMGIIRLHQENRLSIDDDIRKYIPELPDFGHVITIRHLLHHTSGIRDIHSLLAIAGWRDEDPRSNDDLMRILKDQRDLNFIPGEEYMYNNTGYILMAKIIESVTGNKFVDWMKNEIFTPLGLSNTYIEDLSIRVIKGNAASYNKLDNNSYVRATEYWNYYGSGNVHTTVKDLLIWLNYFTNPLADWKTSFDLLQTVDNLNNGKKNNYAFGIEIADYKGEKRIQHGGGVGGFRSYACVFPNKQICIVALTNFSSSQPEQKVNLLAEIILPELANKVRLPETDTVKYTNVPVDNLEKYAGDYWCNAMNVARKLYIKNDTLWFFRSIGNESPLQYIGNDEFIMFSTVSKLKVKLLFEGNNDKTMLVGAGDPNNYYKPYTPVNITTKYLSEFTGQFYSPELKTIYTFTLKNDTLTGYHPKYGDFKIGVLKQDLFQSQKPLGTITFIRDGSKKIIGIRVAYDRVKNFWLEKLNWVDIEN